MSRSYQNNSPYVTQSLALNRQGVGAIIGTKGAIVGSIVRLKANTGYVVGRDPSSCNVVVNSATVSRVHCVISHDTANGLYEITDRSKNGTFINGSIIGMGRTVLARPGDTIYLGTGNDVLRLG